MSPGLQSIILIWERCGSRGVFSFFKIYLHQEEQNTINREEI